MVYAQFYFITEIPGFPVKQNKNMNFVFVDIFSSSSLDRPGEQNPKKNTILVRVRGHITCKQFRIFYLGRLIFEHFGAYHLTKKSRNLVLMLNGTAIFLKNPSGNCRQPPEVVLFSRVGTGGSFLTIC